MKPLHTLIAFVLLLALGGTFYYLTKQPAKPAEGEIPKKKLFSFQPDQVEEFTMEAPDQPAATFRREAAAPPASESNASTASQASPNKPSDWQVVAPPDVAADSSEVQSFLTDLPKVEYTPLDGVPASSLADFGLDAPQKVLQLKLKQGQTVKLSIGRENPSGSARYGKLDSSPEVFLLDTADAKPLDKTLFDLRDKRVLPLNPEQAQQVELALNFTPEQAKEFSVTVPHARIVVSKLPNGDWALTEPAVRTDYSATNYLVSSLTSTRMVALTEEAPKSLAEYGLSSPPLQVQVRTLAGPRQFFAGGRTKEGVGFYAKNSLFPQVFTIPQLLYDQLKQDVDNYRNRYLFDFLATNIQRMEIQGPTGELRLDKRGEEWFRAGTPEKKLDAAKVGPFVDSLRSMRIQQYSTDAPGRFAFYGLDKPWLKVKVTFGERDQEETIVFATKDKRFYATRVGEPSVYEMPPAEPGNLEAKLKDIGS